MKKRVGLLLLALLAFAPMAEAASIPPVAAWISGLQQTITWSGMTGASDTPTSARIAGCLEQGSMDDTTYATLDDTAGTPSAFSFTAARVKHVQHRGPFIQPGLLARPGNRM